MKKTVEAAPGLMAQAQQMQAAQYAAMQHPGTIWIDFFGP
jgi:hypothetical protein